LHRGAPFTIQTPFALSCKLKGSRTASHHELRAAQRRANDGRLIIPNPASATRNDLDSRAVRREERTTGLARAQAVGRVAL
jgi:hypothetical protein